MKSLIILCLLPLARSSCPDVIERREWDANPAKGGNVQCMSVRSGNILIHHTYIPKICRDTKTCKANMKSMQVYHQQDRKWTDIGYNFCIGGDGKIYEGRGWGVVAYPSNGYQYNSTNICFIGDYTKDLPSKKMLQQAVNLIDCGIKLGYIENPPMVMGIREVINTISPGDKLQRYIEKTRFGYRMINSIIQT